ncbi:MAG: hypothetical protein V6D39_06890 [Dolichospermum lemmermannii FEM_B0920]
MIQVLIWIFVAGSFWDVVTSFLGIVGIFGVTDFQLSSLGVYITALIASVMILGLSLNFEEIWSEYADDSYRMLRPIHIIAVIFDAYTSFLGTAQYVILRDSSRSYFTTIGFGEVWNSTSFEQKFALLFVTMLVTLSPILLNKFGSKY